MRAVGKKAGHSQTRQQARCEPYEAIVPLIFPTLPTSEAQREVSQKQQQKASEAKIVMPASIEKAAGED